ncbi:LuxR family transcriptional regulator [Microbacterium jejuense]|uniref:LuxR family transcriptional regulator n=1 Tax=Microbacterium jejuense TaxID=1263637 RepID=A0ABS7HQ71_9MICO|nr:LuxR C-terminal-related transcriptional regulator [Microbacterium jejuense]MBW9094865.1 LuxR family transcriptional regulator [Microbacterium jejuense]
MPPHAVDRPALRRQLDAALHSPLALVVAPAGAGKTVLITQWTQCRPDLAVAWFDLSATDRAAGSFVRRLCAGIAAVAPRFSPPDPPAVTARARLGEPFLVDLAERLAEAGDIVLVFDDLDQLSKTAVLTDLWRLVDLLPGNAHAIFSSRVDLDLGWSRHRLEHDLVEIRQRELAFDDETTGKVLSAIAGRQIAPATAAAVTAQTEGWAAGVQLTALRLRFAEDPARVVEELTETNQLVMNYLSVEVLDGLRPDRRDALMRLAVLDEMSAGLVEAVADIAGGDEFLTGLERDSLFLVRVPGRPGWFRLHRLFRDLLTYRLRATDSAAEGAVLEAAADWFLASGDTDTAVDYLLRGRRWTRGMDLILGIGPGPSEEARSAKIVQWLSLVPPDVREARSDAVLLLAIANTMSGHPSSAVDTLQRLVADHRLTVGRRQIALAYLAAEVQFHPHPELFADIAGEALDLLATHPDADPPDLIGLTSPVLLQLTSHVSAGRALLMLGRIDEARAQLAAALSPAALAYARHRVHALGTLAIAEALSGLLTSAWEHANESLDVARDVGAHGHPAPADAHLARALVCIQRGEAGAGAASLAVAVTAAASDNRTQLLWLSHAASRVIHPRDVPDEVEALGPPPPLVRQSLLSFSMREARLKGGHSSLPAPSSEWSAVAFEEVAGLVGAGRTAQARERLAQLRAAGVQPHPIASIEADALAAWLCAAEGHRVAARDHLETALQRAHDERLARPFLRVGPPLLDLLDEVPTGRTDFGRSIAERLRAQGSPGSERLVDELTPRELELIGYLPTRYTIADIAERCFLSTNTIKTHLAHIYRKLGVASRDAAIERATELGLFETREGDHVI